MLTVTTINEGQGFSVLRATGELDAFTVDDFRSALAQLAPMDEVVVDLSAVVFVDSAGLGALIGGIRRVREQGATVALACAQPSLLRLLHTTGFEQVVTIATSVNDARQSLSTAPPTDPHPGAQRRAS